VGLLTTWYGDTSGSEDEEEGLNDGGSVLEAHSDVLSGWCGAPLLLGEVLHLVHMLDSGLILGAPMVFYVR